MNCSSDLSLRSSLCTAVAQRIEQVFDVGHGTRVRIPPVVHTLSSLTVRRVGLLLFTLSQPGLYKGQYQLSINIPIVWHANRFLC